MGSPSLQSPSALGIWIAALLWLAGCGESPGAQGGEAPTDRRSPITQIQAAVVLEPPALKIGEVVSAQITVVTPPDHRLLPISPPTVTGAWLLDAIPRDVERSGARWVHRTQVRLRTHDVGPLVWPAFNVVVEDSAGARHSVEVGERSFEVVSVMQDFPDQLAPFGLRTLEAPRSSGSFWSGAGVGAASALALVAVVLAFYWVRDRVPVESEAAKRLAHEREATLWEWADSELAQATAALGSPEGPRDAANRGARLLRQYAARRFNLQIEALTTEELDATKPPLAIDSRWPEFVRILRHLDAERFCPSQVDVSSVAPIRSEIEAVKRFVDDSLPPELRR